MRAKFTAVVFEVHKVVRVVRFSSTQYRVDKWERRYYQGVHVKTSFEAAEKRAKEIARERGVPCPD